MSYCKCFMFVLDICVHKSFIYVHFVFPSMFYMPTYPKMAYLSHPKRRLVDLRNSPWNLPRPFARALTHKLIAVGSASGLGIGSWGVSTPSSKAGGQEFIVFLFGWISNWLTYPKPRGCK